MLQHGWVWPPLALPMSGHHSRHRRGGETRELNVTQWLMAQRVVQGHTPVHPWAIWLKWRRYEWSSVRYHPATKAIFSDDYRMAAYDHVRSSPFLADILTFWVLIWGCVLYIGLQIFIWWQKSKVGVRIIFDGVLYSKFYGILSFILSLRIHL